MDDELNKAEKPKKKPVKKAKTYHGFVINPIKIGSKYDFTGKKGQKVTGFTKKEYESYKKNKIIE